MEKFGADGKVVQAITINPDDAPTNTPNEGVWKNQVLPEFGRGVAPLQRRP